MGLEQNGRRTGFTTRQKLQEAGISGYSGQPFRKRPRQSGISRYRTAEHAHDVLPRPVINRLFFSLNHMVMSSLCYENRCTPQQARTVARQNLEKSVPWCGTGTGTHHSQAPGGLSLFRYINSIYGLLTPIY